jgi:phytoene dehydrogenase-like protein
LVSARGWLETRYESELVRALLAPWVLHCGLGPEAAYSGQMAKVIALALEQAGAPIVTGGAARLLEAFQRLIQDQGSTILTGADVERVVLDDSNRATGVRLSDGSEIEARRGVICSMTPTQLYGRLLADAAVAREERDFATQFRYGRGDMQVHYALKSPPKWKTGDFGKVAIIHLTPGLDGVSKAVNEGERGMLPAVPTICLGQPAALDPSRCPEGRFVLWLQMLEVPRVVKGDAAGEIAVPADGRWSESLREAYADRVEQILAQHIESFGHGVIARKAYSPADLEQLNINLVGGDPYGGACSIDQFFLWRPYRSTINHRTKIANLYHIGASTHPGPGLGGGSGFAIANYLA